MAKPRKPKDSIEAAAPSTAPAELPDMLEIKVQCLSDASVFGAKAAPMADMVVSDCGGDRVKGLFAFMGLELAARMAAEKDPAERSRWEDAGNITAGLKFLAVDEGFIISGKDVEGIKAEMNSSMETVSDPVKMFALAKAYLAARRHFFPETKPG